jgi:hypothetical protein
MKLAALFITCLTLINTSLAYNATGPITYLGSKGALLSGGTSVQGLVFISGTVPSLNGTIVPGGIRNETVKSPIQRKTINPSSFSLLKVNLFLCTSPHKHRHHPR